MQNLYELRNLVLLCLESLAIARKQGKLKIYLTASQAVCPPILIGINFDLSKIKKTGT